MAVSAAIFYVTDGYDTSGKRLLGRQSAGEGFLKGWTRYSQSEVLYCLSPSRAGFREFCDRVRPWSSRSRPVVWLPADEPDALSQAGTLYYPSPGIGDWAWTRRLHDQRAYSLCGITHTTASQAVMQAVSELYLAPVQPWDALICTSEAVKQGIAHLLDRWGDYLRERLGAASPPPLQLPVIPLGIDTTAFPTGDRAREARRRWRDRWGLDESAIVVLFLGRLISYAKAHPVPMYLSLERAARATGKSVVLVQAGWFEAETDETAFREGARQHCPSVKAVFVDGREPAVREQVWAAADVFMSLADNIQETFGLTPIEAMAAGLPVVVSDWNGYRESVRHEIDGFRVPTTLAPSGTGREIASEYFTDRLSYGTYVGESAMLAAVDIHACASYLARLFDSPELRRKLGENGRARARSHYDWQVVVAQYEELWLALARRRASQPMCVPVTGDRPANPICDDPMRAFSHYPTHVLGEGTRLRLGQMSGAAARDRLFSLWIDTVGQPRRLSPEEIDKIVTWVGQQEPTTVATLFAAFHIDGRSPTGQRLLRTLAYLLKFDVLARA